MGLYTTVLHVPKSLICHRVHGLCVYIPLLLHSLLEKLGLLLKQGLCMICIHLFDHTLTADGWLPQRVPQLSPCTRRSHPFLMTYEIDNAR